MGRQSNRCRLAGLVALVADCSEAALDSMAHHHVWPCGQQPGQYCHNGCLIHSHVQRAYVFGSDELLMICSFLERTRDVWRTKARPEVAGAA